MNPEQDILIGEDHDLVLHNGDFTVGDSFMQEVEMVLRMNQGDLKSDPLLGVGLTRFMNGQGKNETINTLVKLHLTRDGKNYDEVKSLIKISIKNA